MKWNDELDQKLRDGAAANRSPTEIGKELGCTLHAVSARASKLGVSMNSRVWPEAKADRFRDLVASRFTTRQIADKMGLAKSTVYAKALELGLVIALDPRRAANKARQLSAGQGFVSDGQPKPPQATTTKGPVAKSLNLYMWDDAFCGCRWPTMEDTEGHRFCCAPKDPDQPYCDDHGLGISQPQASKPKYYETNVRARRRASADGGRLGWAA